jgi:hypothetical protein
MTSDPHIPQFGSRYWMRLGRESDRCKSDVFGEGDRRRCRNRAFRDGLCKTHARLMGLTVRCPTCGRSG